MRSMCSAVAVVLMTGPIAAQGPTAPVADPSPFVVRTLDGAGALVGESLAVPIAELQLLVPALSLFGAESITVQSGGTLYRVDSVRFGDGIDIACLHLSPQTPIDAALVVAQAASPPRIPDRLTFQRDGAEMRLVNSYAVGPWWGFGVHVEPGTPPPLLGTPLLDARGQLAGLVTDPARDIESGMLYVTRTTGVQSHLPESPIAWGQLAVPAHRSANARLIRVLQSADSLAARCDALELMRADDPAWARNLSAPVARAAAEIALDAKRLQLVLDLAAGQADGDSADHILLRIMSAFVVVSQDAGQPITPLADLERRYEQPHPWAAARAARFLGQTAADRGNAEAPEHFERAWRLSRSTDLTALTRLVAHCIRINDRDGYLRWTRRLMEIDDRWQVPISAARQCSKWGMHHEALAFARAALDRWPERPQFLLELAAVQRGQGDNVGARATLAELRAALPGSQSAWVWGWELMPETVGRDERRRYADSWQTSAAHAEAFLRPAAWWMKQKEHNAAIEELERGHETFGSSPEYVATYGLALSNILRHDDAWKVISSGMSSIENDPEYLYIAAFVALDGGRFRETIKACRRMRTINPDKVEATILLAIAHHLLGEGEAAETELAKLRQSWPEAPATPPLLLEYYKQRRLETPP